MQEHDALERELKELVLFEERGVDPTGKLSKMDKKAIKARVRMIKNRLAAKRSREHARTYVQELEGTLEALQSKNEALARRLAALEAENDKLKRNGGLPVAGGDERDVEETKDRNSEPAAGCGPLPLGSPVDPSSIASSQCAIAAVPVVSSSRRQGRASRRAGACAAPVRDGGVDEASAGRPALGTPTARDGGAVCVSLEAAPAPLPWGGLDEAMADHADECVAPTVASASPPVTVPSSPGKEQEVGEDMLGDFNIESFTCGGLGLSRSEEGNVLGCFDHGEASCFPFDDMVCAPEWAAPAGGDVGMMCAL